MKFLNLIKPLQPYTGRLVLTLLGLVTAILFLVLGFGKTLLILLCCTIGYWLGVAHDKRIDLVRLIMYWYRYFRDKWV